MVLENLATDTKDATHNLKIFLKWVLCASIVGICVGGVGTLFHFAVEFCTETFQNYPVVIFALPIGGLIIVLLYKSFNMLGHKGTNLILLAVRSDEQISFVTAPLIFISTAITHLLGGSSGREGAALQLGGSLGMAIGKLLKMDHKDMHIITMCGMSAAFSALFGTPVTSAIFSMEVISVGLMHYSAAIPCVVSAIIGYAIAGKFGIEPTRFMVSGVPSLTVESGAQVIVLSMLCALLSVIFCKTLHFSSATYKKFFKNPFGRIFIGGCLVIVVTFIFGTYDYNGAGMGIIQGAFTGEIVWYAFILKIFLTAVTLGCGYKGGEIVPAFFVGATFGNVVGGLLGLSPSFGAGIGLVALFCGTTNCPLTSLIMSIELFGQDGILFYSIASAVSYMLSGYYSLYSEQKIMYSKLKPEFINKKTE